MMGKEDKKVWKAHINEDNNRREKSKMIDMIWGVGIAMQQMHKWAIYGKLSNGTSGRASNFLAQEDLELIWGGSSLEYTSQVL